MTPYRASAACFALVLASCESQEDAGNAASGQAPAASTVSYAGNGRDRLCLSEGSGRAGFVTYGQGDFNCSVSGTAQRAGARITIVPDGDTTCRIEATLAGNDLRLGEAGSACAYYCGPTASFAGKSFRRTDRAEPATDLAGDPLC